MVDENHWEIFRKRGIKPEIRDARPYISYTVENREPVREAHEGKGLNRWQRAFAMSIAGQCSGLVITRHAPPNLGLGPVPPELRPDEEVRTQPVYKDAKKARYVFTPNRTILKYWEDDHDRRFATRPEARAAHVDRAHNGVDVSGPHWHSRKVKDRDNGPAKRIDMHPLAPPIFEKASRAFFVIEGCLKADAIQSRDEAAAGSPSVTLWDAPELPAVVERYYVGRATYIVCDSDWYDNDLVITQAMLCRSRFRELGVRAVYVCAPPMRETPDEKGSYKNGADDYLGDYPEKGPDDFLVIGREPSDCFDQWVREQTGRWTGIVRDANVLQNLSLHARATDGGIRKCVSTFARIMDTNPKNVYRAIASLQERPGLYSRQAITVEGSLETSRGRWFGRYYDASLDWEEKPTITIAPELRAKEMPARRLGDVDGMLDDRLLGFITRDVRELKALRTR